MMWKQYTPQVVKKNSDPKLRFKSVVNDLVVIMNKELCSQLQLNTTINYASSYTDPETRKLALKFHKLYKKGRLKMSKIPRGGRRLEIPGVVSILGFEIGSELRNADFSKEGDYLVICLQ